MADSDESDPEDIDYDELNTSSDEEKEEELDAGEQKFSLADIVAHKDIQQQIQKGLSEKEKLANLPEEIRSMPDYSVIKQALVQLLVYSSDTLYGVYRPGGIKIQELTLACGYCRTLPSVRNIILAGNNIGPDAADPICWCLTNEAVRAVDLSNNPLTDVLVRQVGKILRIQNEVLILSKHCEFSHEAVLHREADKVTAEKVQTRAEEKLEKAVEKLEKVEGGFYLQNSKKLRHLEAASAHIDECEAGLKQSKEGVDLSKQKIEEAKGHLQDMESRLEVKINVLKKAPGMRVLRPQSSERRLQNMVGSGCKLERLVLGGCQITDIGGAELAKALRAHGSLKTLTLSDNKLTSITAIAIAENLKLNTKLETLDLGFNLIDDAGGVALAEWVGGSPSVVRVMLNKTQIGRDTYAAFTKAINQQIDEQDEGRFRMLMLNVVPDDVKIPMNFKDALVEAVREYEDIFDIKKFILNMAGAENTSRPVPMELDSKSSLTQKLEVDYRPPTALAFTNGTAGRPKTATDPEAVRFAAKNNKLI
jgi:hypothetical protein